MLFCQLNELRSLDEANDFAWEKNRLIKLQQNDTLQFYKTITEYELDALMKLTEKYPEIADLCQSPDFNQHWENVIRHSGKNPPSQASINGLPVHQYLPQWSILPFAFVKGLHAYNKYLLLTKTGKRGAAENALALAIKYGNFNGMNAFCKKSLLQLQNHFDLALLYKVIAVAERAAKLHCTPGFLLLANIYLQVSALTSLIDEKVQSKLEKEYLLLSFQSIIIAENIQPISQEMVNNAFQGKSIQEAVGNETMTWGSWKEKIYNLAKNKITINELNEVYHRAQQIIKHIEEEHTQRISKTTITPSPATPYP